MGVSRNKPPGAHTKKSLPGEKKISPVQNFTANPIKLVPALALKKICIFKPSKKLDTEKKVHAQARTGSFLP